MRWNILRLTSFQHFCKLGLPPMRARTTAIQRRPGLKTVLKKVSTHDFEIVPLFDSTLTNRLLEHEHQA